MTMLSNVDIRRELSIGMLRVVPERPNTIQPASIDLHLGGIGESNMEGYILMPGRFVLASTLERIVLPDYIAGRVEGVSTIGRKGIIPHCAGFIDPGFSGHITLEVANVGRDWYHLVTGDRICQIAFFYTQTPASPAYNGRYQNQGAAPTPARLPLFEELAAGATQADEF